MGLFKHPVVLRGEDKLPLGCDLAYRLIDEAEIKRGEEPFPGGTWLHVSAVKTKPKASVLLGLEGDWTGQVQELVDQAVREELIKRIVRFVQASLLTLEEPEKAKLVLLDEQWMVETIVEVEEERSHWMDATFAITCPRS